ncbi:vWA domain-containing protein [Catellatospora sichuanensis]|uniref:vWA domain-containing protein n=1 Tax=Catellatospora sichuanensis TaxID=1969805 RepID=UPI00118417B6|nr:VWA domain-containing protein [Catellatospora sichuanensis]
MIRQPIRRLVAAVLALLLAAFANLRAGDTAIASAVDTCKQVCESLKAANKRAHYVFLLDVSHSMHDRQLGNLYERAIGIMRHTLAFMTPEDHVTIITFSDKPSVGRQGPLGDSPDLALRGLPKSADGSNDVNLGLAIDQAITAAEADDDAAATTLLLITDSLHLPLPESKYPFRDGRKWDELRSRAEALGAGRLLAFYAGLRANSDAALMRSVIPDAADFAVKSPGYAQRLVATTRDSMARSLLLEEADGVVSVSWPRDEVLDNIRMGRNVFPVIFRNRSKYLPITVHELRITVTGGKAAAYPSADRLTLQPNASETIDVTLEWPAGPASMAPSDIETINETLEITGRFDSPYLSEVESLGVSKNWHLDDASQMVRGSVELGHPRIWGIGTGLAIVITLALLILFRRRPKLIGRLKAGGAGESTSSFGEVYLEGRKIRVPGSGRHLASLPGTAVIRGTRKPGIRPRLDLLEITFSPTRDGKRRVIAECEPNSSVIINGVEFRWDADIQPPNMRDLIRSQR